MKSARELFEELGYKFVGESSVITYQKPIKNYLGEGYSNITFNKDNWTYYAIDFINVVRDETLMYKKYYDTVIDMELLQAINKQVEELGWK